MAVAGHIHACWRVAGLAAVAKTAGNTLGDGQFKVHIGKKDVGGFAAEFLMDYLKTRAPFWKQVETASGKTWVAAKAGDDTAAERWEVRRREREAAE